MMLIDMIVGIGLVAMFWCLSDKYGTTFDDIHRKLSDRFKFVPKSLCIMCISFWLLLVYFLVIGEPILTSVVKSLASTPFVLELTNRIWRK